MKGKNLAQIIEARGFEEYEVIRPGDLAFKCPEPVQLSKDGKKGTFPSLLHRIR